MLTFRLPANRGVCGAFARLWAIARAVLMVLPFIVLGVGCKRTQQAADLLEAVACADGDKAACKRAFDASRKRCEGGDGEACVRHGLQYENERVVPKDEAKAAELFEQACAKGSADGCWYASSRYASGRGVTKDEARAATFAETACTRGSVNGCHALGTLYKHGRGRTKDLSLAEKAFARACALSKRPDGSGCGEARSLASGAGDASPEPASQ